jgi:23S rRNA pseudouridine1911/1915/1917 synthase
MKKDVVQIVDAIALLWNDIDCLVVAKPATLPVQSDLTGDPDLLSMLLQKPHQFESLHLINRLDRVASGAVLFAKNQKAAAALHLQFEQRVVEKKYLAWVSQAPPKEAGELIHFLKKNNNNKAICQDQPAKDFQKAILHYQLVAQSDRYFLLEITLQTGRFHQIRAQLAHIGCHIKGDVKYGARRANLDRSIHLHAWKLAFEQPKSQQRIELEAPLPSESLWNLAKQLLQNNIDTGG